VNERSSREVSSAARPLEAALAGEVGRHADHERAGAVVGPAGEGEGAGREGRQQGAAEDDAGIHRARVCRHRES
jgi:hypothetical protein